jgi:hypothetical protein
MLSGRLGAGPTSRCLCWIDQILLGLGVREMGEELLAMEAD